MPNATLPPPQRPLLGSDERHFNVSITVTNKVTCQCPQTTTFKRDESRSGTEPRSVILLTSLTARPSRLKRAQVHCYNPNDSCIMMGMMMMK